MYPLLKTTLSNDKPCRRILSEGYSTEMLSFVVLRKVESKVFIRGGKSINLKV